MKTGLKALVGWAAFFCFCIVIPAPGGALLREVWTGLSGTAVANLTDAAAYPATPSSTDLVTAFEAPSGIGDNYGQRIHGYLVPPVSGAYTFWIASDDSSVLQLSASAAPTGLAAIASVSGYTSSREWTKYGSQQSAAITLTAGTPYYVAALMKEGTGGDNLAVRWLRPDGVDQGPIPGDYLLPWGTTFGPPVIQSQPTNTLAVEGGSAAFEVILEPPSDAACQWFRDGATIPAATATRLVLTPVALVDHGAEFHVVATNAYGAATSSVAVLSVAPDLTPPALLSALNRGASQVELAFSEPLASASATVTAHYAISPNVSILGAVPQADPAFVRLAVARLTLGQAYTVTVHHVTDRAATPNPIAPDSMAVFLASELQPAPIGGGAETLTRLDTGSFDLTARGAGMGGPADDFALAWEERTGDFDVAVCVADVDIVSADVRAGLMARATLDTNAPFAAVFGSSAQFGSFFESRASAGDATTRASVPGGYPAHYPRNWLRLRRAGNVFTGYASFDGRAWTALGGVTLSLPATLPLGLAVAGQNTNATVTARFREYGPPNATGLTAFAHTREWPTPCSRRTGLVFSEIMYNPLNAPGDTNDYEFIELYNAGAIFQDLGGWRIADGVAFTFPDGFLLGPGQFVVVARQPEALRAAHGITNVLGPFDGALANAGEALSLRDDAGAIRLTLEYASEPPWPVAADGGGHSLVLAAPSYGEADPRAWAASRFAGGSPGQVELLAPEPPGAVVINEILAHTDDPQLDYIELHNPATGAVAIGGCYLTDTRGSLRFRIPDGVILLPRGHRVFDQLELGFSLDAGGETVWLLATNGQDVIDVVRFSGQENGVTIGRCPDGAPTFRRLALPTPGAANAGRRPEELVIAEIFYNPVPDDDDLEFVELYNRGTGTVALADWRFTAGIDFQFPTGLALPPGGRLVVARNLARLRANHPHLTDANSVGDYAGRLGNDGERLALAKPEDLVSTNEFGDFTTQRVHIVVCEVAYRTGGQWSRWSDGGGASLELTDPDADPLIAANWADSDESAKAPWTDVAFTGRLDNGNSSFPPERLYLGLLNDGECLVDDLRVYKWPDTTVNLATNAGFEAGTNGWGFFGNHAKSVVTNAGAFEGARCLYVRSDGGLDTGPNSIRGNLPTGALVSGDTVVVAARVRWLAGWPELLFRFRGNWADFAAVPVLPAGAGTPALPNSRALANAGPALHDVTHTPALPRTNEVVLVTARADDPDGLAALELVYRLDPATNLTRVVMRDDGAQGDALAGDGLFTARLAGQAGGALLVYRIEARDTAGAAAVFPRRFPDEACLIRWNEPTPFGSFPRAHLLTTQANRNPADGRGLNNAWRNGTLIYGHRRVMYNIGFRDKGSPFHDGDGDITLVCPADDRLHGVRERVFAQTGNGGSEETGLRGRVAAWLGARLGIPHLHANYMRFYINGSALATLCEDLEEPSHDYAEQFYPDGGAGDLYKISYTFEFPDALTGTANTQSTLDYFTTVGNELKLARYRWNWERRARRPPESDYTTIFDMARAVHHTGADVEARILAAMDVDRMMRVFSFHHLTGNWDSWCYGRGQNMYLYRQPGRGAVVLPWDVDFVFGAGDGATSSLFGTQDTDMQNKVFARPAFRRMFWRAYQRAVAGPMLEARFAPVIAALRQSQLQNGMTLTDPAAVYTYINARRDYIQSQLAANDAKAFALTSNRGNAFTSTTASVTITGAAPFAVASLLVNGAPHPATWTGFTNFTVAVPLTGVTNVLTVAGFDDDGAPVPGAEAAITVYYFGAIPQPRGHVVINEIHYNPLVPQTGFIELHNRHTTMPFDLSGFRLDGVGYTFPAGSVMPTNAFWVLAADPSAFQAHYGAGVPVFDQFSGGLANDGEILSLMQPAGTGEVRVCDVRYGDRWPWPAEADGKGSSLQLLDPALDPWRPANWAAAPTSAVGRTTPGATNATRVSLAPFPEIWINEVLPREIEAVSEEDEIHPYIEICNSGTASVDLADYYLTDSSNAPTRWRFPAGAAIEPGGFLTVWADGNTGASTPASPHTSFSPNPGTGVIALVRLQAPTNGPGVLDYIVYDGLPAGRSIGLWPDGEPRDRRLLFYPTPGASNNPAVPAVRVVINEFLADNKNTLTDPADGKYEDWFELYNAGTDSADLTGYYLTDDLDDPDKFPIPAGYAIPAGGFLLVWADNTATQNVPARADLHVNFALSKSGEALGLFAPDGRLVDGFAFGAQTTDVSKGRYPDGDTDPTIAFTTPTPRAPNLIAGGNQPPVIAPLPTQTVAELSLLTLVVSATDPDAGQTVTYSLGANAPAGATVHETTGVLFWTPTEAQGPATHVFTVRATDNGVPPRTGVASVTVVVEEINRPPVLEVIPDASLDEGASLTIAVAALDPDLPGNTLGFALEPGAPAGAAIGALDGVLTWASDESHGGNSYTFTVRATDDGTPPLSATQTLRVTVQEVENPPVIEQPAPQNADEMQPFSLVLTAYDPEGQPVVFSLDAPAAQGLTLDPDTGAIAWTPTEAQGPGQYPLYVRATETGGAGLSAQAVFSIHVHEVNQAPILTPVTNQMVADGATLRFSVTAQDTDEPAQTLAYTLAGAVPAGAAIGVLDGVFTWDVAADAPAAAYDFDIIVADNGPGTLAATQTVRVTVAPRFGIAFNEIMANPGAADGSYIELINASGVTAWDLTGYRLVGDALEFAFPAATVLAPGALVCVAADLVAFRTAYGDAPVLAGAWTGSLGSGGDDLRLLAPDGATVRRIRFGAGAPWPAPATGVALQALAPRRDNARVGNWAVATAYTGPRAPVVMTNLWRYYQSGPPESGWQDLDFDDAAWASGPALLYVEDSTLSAPKNTALNLGQSAYYFRTAFDLPTRPDGAELAISHILDDGAVFYLNGEEILRFGIASNVVVQHSTTAASVNNAVSNGPYRVGGQALRAGANVLAVEVHQVNGNSTDIVLGAALDIVGGDAPGLTPGATNSTARALDEFPPVYVNEIAAGADAPYRDAQGEDEPWIELYNAGEAPIDLTGWALSEDAVTLDRWLFPAGSVIAAGQWLVVVADGEADESTADEPHTSFRLTAPATYVLLSRPQAGGLAVADFLAPDAPPGAGQAFVAWPDGQLFERAVSSCPTPGAPNRLTAPNHAPMIEPVTNRSLRAGRTIELQLCATDPDAGQTLSFDLLSPPDGMHTGPEGALTWTPTPVQTGVWAVAARVTDDGVPPLTDDTAFEVTVLPLPPPPALVAAPVAQGLEFAWEAEADVVLHLQAADQATGAWNTISTYTGAAGAAAMDIDPLRNERYFRLQAE